MQGRCSNSLWEETYPIINCRWHQEDCGLVVWLLGAKAFVNPLEMLEIIFDIKCYIKAKSTQMSLVGVLYCNYPAQGLPSHFMLQILSISTVSVSSWRLLTRLTLLCGTWPLEGHLPFLSRIFLHKVAFLSTFPSYPSTKIYLKLEPYLTQTNSATNMF